jgi:hypothetical protein
MRGLAQIEMGGDPTAEENELENSYALYASLRWPQPLGQQSWAPHQGSSARWSAGVE